MKKIKSNQIVDAPSKTFDYEGFEKEAIGRLNGGASLVGPDGVLVGLIQRIVNAALSGEADSHIQEEKASGMSNRRNGHTSKVLDTELGPVPISPPRDRAGSFKPQLVGKWERQLGTGLDKQSTPTATATGTSSTRSSNCTGWTTAPPR